MERALQQGRRSARPTMIAGLLGQFEADTIWPIAPFLHQSGSHRVLANVLPFLFRRFIRSEQSIETARLPLPRRLQILTDESLDRSRGVSNRRLAFDWCDQEMDVIGHQDGGDNIPFRQAQSRP